MTEITAEVVTITPEMAARWLADDERPQNRAIRPTDVRKLVNDIHSDRWQVNGEAFKFTADGKLVDGQHRAQAIIEAGKSVQALAIHGITPDAYRTLDRGRRRSVADYLHIHGIPDANNVAAAAAQLIVYQEHGTFQLTKVDRYPGPDEVLDFVLRHDRLIECVRRAHTIRGGSWGIPVSTLGTLYYLFSELSAEDAEMFFHKLRYGYEMAEDDPILVLRNRLGTVTALRRRLPRDEFAAIFIKSWNAYRKGEPLKALSFRAGGSRPERMPAML